MYVWHHRSIFRPAKSPAICQVPISNWISSSHQTWWHYLKQILTVTKNVVDPVAGSSAFSVTQSELSTKHSSIDPLSSIHSLCANFTIVSMYLYWTSSHVLVPLTVRIEYPRLLSVLNWTECEVSGSTCAFLGSSQSPTVSLTCQ